MKYRSYLTAFAAFCVMLGTSCSKETNNYYDDDDNNNNNGDERTPIRLSSNVELGTLRLQDNQIANGQSLSFFVTPNQDPETVLYNNIRITADGGGGFTYAETMYYPTNGNNVDFYAVHPYSGSATMEGEISFSIVADQSEQAGYLNSDLLYATQDDVARTTSAVPMRFYHRLAKLDFVIIQGAGADISGLNAITALNILPSTTIELVEGALGGATGTPTDVIPYGVDNVGDPVNGRLSGITAIIVPQTIDEGSRLFRIRLGTIDYFYTADEDLVFEAGKKYTLQLTINQASISLQSSIADWTDGGTIIGGGTIE